MEAVTNFLFSSETLAILIPILIFLITLYLIIKRFINFFIMLILLGFAVVSGLAIVNHGLVGKYMEGDLSTEHYEELKDSLFKFKDQVFEAFDELKLELKQQSDDTESMHQLMGRTQDLMIRIKEQEQRMGVLFQAASSADERG